jgi:hypothetical protein
MPEEAVADLRRRIGSARLPSQELVDDRSQGVQLATIRELARYWAGDYDWRACEARLNALPQFTTAIDGVDIHFIHVRSPHENALPLIMTHGWPGSVIELLGAIGPLTDPPAHGGSAADAFDLVLPSVPGYGFSGEPAEVGWNPGRTPQLGRAVLPHPHLLPRCRQRRPLRRLGRTRSLHHRNPRSIQLAALNQTPKRRARAARHPVPAMATGEGPWPGHPATGRALP